MTGMFVQCPSDPTGYCSSLRTRGLEGQAGEVTLLYLRARPQLSSFMLEFSSPCLPVSPLLRQLWPRAPHHQLGTGNCDLARGCTEPAWKILSCKRLSPNPANHFLAPRSISGPWLLTRSGSGLEKLIRSWGIDQSLHLDTLTQPAGKQQERLKDSMKQPGA